MLRRAAVATTLLAASLAPAATAGAAAPPAAVPTSAEEVRLQSRFVLPPQAYSLDCTHLANCTTAGEMDLTAAAQVDLETEKATGAVRGTGPLAITAMSGAVQMAYACGDDGQFVSRVEPGAAQAGELEVADVQLHPAANEMAVTLNHGGDAGNEFPLETMARSDGGCGAPPFASSPKFAQWYRHFYMAHREGQQEQGVDLVLDGLAYQDGVFTRTFQRPVAIESGGYSYLVHEVTRVDVVPQTCAGAQNRIVSATVGGQPAGLSGSRFFAGQVVGSTLAEMEIELGDGSVIRLKKGDHFRVERCDENFTRVYLGETVGRFWAHVKKALGGGRAKFEVSTPRAVSGVRGTIFTVGYDKGKALTRLAVKEGAVSLKGINGARGQIVVRTGQVGVQRGKAKPRFVKR